MNRIDLPHKSPPIRPETSDSFEPGQENGHEQEILWQRAQRRALVYLQVMRAPTLDGHELVMKALKLAHQAIQNAGQGDPVKETVRILRRLMNDRGLFASAGPQYGRWFKYGSLRHGAFRKEGDLSGGMTSMPPIHRGVMSTDRK